jgi:hypothetical protein
MAWYLESTRAPGLRFKIVKLDKASMTATLQGVGSTTTFTRSISEADLQKYGYKVVNVPDAPVPPPLP